MKKRVFATVLSLVLAMSLVACGGKKEETAANNASTASAAQTQEKKQEPVVAATTEKEPVEKETVEETPATRPIPENAGLFKAGGGSPYTLYPTKFIITPYNYNPDSKGLYIRLDFDFDPDTRTITCVQTNSPVEDAPANALDYTDIVPQWDEKTRWEDVLVPLNLMIPGDARGTYDATAYPLYDEEGEGNIVYDLYPDDDAAFEAFQASNPTEYEVYEGLMYGTITATYTFPELELKPYDNSNWSPYQHKYYTLPDVGQTVVHGVVFGATDYPVDNTNDYALQGGREYVPQSE